MKRILTQLLYLFRSLFPMDRISIFNRHAVCTECGWSGKYNEARHRSTVQLQARGTIGSKGQIIDAHILNVKRRNGGWVDLTWCPKCDCFIEVYYEKEEQDE